MPLPLMQGTLHILTSGLYNAATAATSFDVPRLAAAASDTARALSSSLLPGFMGGRRSSVRSLFRPDGFFAYADERTAQVGLVGDWDCLGTPAAVVSTLLACW